MSIDVPPFVITTCVSGFLGWLIKLLLDMLGDYIESSKQWRARTDDKLDSIMGATQTTMRASLIHNYEKYAERGWLTPEERASWCDMHDKYAAMGFNGLIDTYRLKLNELPDREI